VMQQTRAPAIVVAVPALGPRLGRSVVRALEAWLSSRPRDQAAP
jgi:hypothetical protein